MSRPFKGFVLGVGALCLSFFLFGDRDSHDYSAKAATTADESKPAVASISPSGDCGQMDAAYKTKILGLAQTTSDLIAQELGMWNKTIEAFTLLCGDAATLPYAKCSEFKDEIVKHRDRMNETKSYLDLILRMKGETQNQ